MSKPLYGGQAVIEGVMIRGPHTMAVAVRDPQGKIVVHQETLTSRLYTNWWVKLPLVRGALVLWDTMALGLRALMFSANVAMVEDDDANRSDTNEHEGSTGGQAMPSGVMWGSMLFALGMATALFFVTPVVIINFLDQFIESSVVSNLVEKLIRLALILGYIGGIGFLPDIKRVFGYHGAEHKVVNAYERDVRLDVRGVQEQTTIHPRCGTTFLIVVVLVSFLVFTLLGRPSLEIRILSRIVLVPVIAGIAYELIRFAAARYSNPIVRLVMAPGLVVQRLTTRQPDDRQAEVAIAAMQAALEAERTYEEHTRQESRAATQGSN